MAEAQVHSTAQDRRRDEAEKPPGRGGSSTASGGNARHGAPAAPGRHLDRRAGGRRRAAGRAAARPLANAAHWMRVIPGLVATHRVIAPDLPGHGASEVTGDGRIDAARVMEWLGGLIEQSCKTPPALVGQLLGGAIAARFASDQRSPAEPARARGHVRPSSVPAGAGVRARLVEFPRAADRAHAHGPLAALRVRPGRAAPTHGRAVASRSKPTTSIVPARRAFRPRLPRSWSSSGCRRLRAATSRASPFRPP